METNYNAEQETFRSSLRRFLDDRAGPGYTRACWHGEPADHTELWREFAALGVTALLVPESAGGLGRPMSDMGVVMEELGRAVCPTPCWASAVGGSSAASTFACEELLAQLASGQKTASIAVAEAGRSFTQWQDARVEVRGETLTGTKVEVPEGAGVDYLFVTTDNGVYLVARDAAGLSAEVEDSVDHSQRTAALHFNNTPGVRLGDNSELAPAIDRMLVALCADGLGAAQRALELTVAYAGERRQFGQAIGSFQAIQHLCADMLQTIELGRAGLHHALWAQDGAAPSEAHRTAVMCKAYMAETFPQIGADAIQIFGGAGFTWEYDIQLYYKRLLSLQMLWGTSEVWLEELATLVIDGEPPPIVPD